MKDTILVIGSSGGIGKAFVKNFKQFGWSVTQLSRSEHEFDMTNEQSIKHHINNLTDQKFNRIIIATGALEINNIRPEKSLAMISTDNTINHFLLNSIGPILCLKHILPLLPKNEQSICGILSARVGSIEDNYLGGWHSYRMSKAALNQGIRGSAIQISRSNPMSTIVALHPGTVETSLTKKYLPRCKYVSTDTSAKNLIKVMNNLNPENTGSFYDYAGKKIPW